MEQILESYYNPRHPGSYGSARTIQKHIAKKVPIKSIKNWLTLQDTYTLHKPVRWYFRRRRVYAKCIDDLWQIDLVDMTSLAKYNDGYKFLLNCIDVFSKFAWSVPLKNKSGRSITDAFAKIITIRKPIHVQSDKGTEFLNSTFQEFLKSAGITFYTTENEDLKACVVERFNRTMKSKMYKYFTYKNTLKYLDILDDLIYSYNNTYHSSIKMTPVDVSIHNEQEVSRRLYPPKNTNLKFKFNIGDQVRISKAHRAFQKGYLPSWSDEIFTIKSRYPSDPVTYEIADYDGEPVKGKFYEIELQKIIKKDDIYKVERVLKTRKKGKKKEYFVKWFGYPDKFNSWVSDLKVI
jgi:transposase InsO family protein